MDLGRAKTYQEFAIYQLGLGFVGSYAHLLVSHDFGDIACLEPAKSTILSLMLYFWLD